ncbi:hypothetical protein ACI3KS_17670 [Microbacterium sp. ZW T5_45]|uniref:hypothetical protein n=1 Tax=Microbacterium sp. ZW T5_45 TaxID=3378080 RepID=UPI0038533C22
MTEEARQRRRTWVVGGILMALAASVGFAARFELAPYHAAKDVLWALAVLVLVVGLGRAGSITRRRPFASTIVLLQVAMAAPPLPTFLSGLVPDDPGNLHAQEDAYLAVMIPYQALLFAVTVVAVILIGAVAALPRPWSWAPACVLALSVLSSTATLAIGFGGPSAVLQRVLYEVPGAGMLLLGVIAIVLGIRAGTQPEFAADPVARRVSP